LNVVSRFFSLAVALSSSSVIAASEVGWWQVLPQWPIAQPLQQIDQRLLQGWRQLQCNRVDATQLWLPAEAAQLGQLIAAFAEWPQQPLAPFASCFQLRLYQANEVTCRLVGERQRLQCDLPLLPQQLQQAHIVYATGGIASAVGNYQINLPITASLNLLGHELAHWLGLADEYQLSDGIAADFCAGNYDHPALNVVVTDTATLTSKELQQLWHRLPWQFAVADWRQLGQPIEADTWRLGSRAEQVGLHAIDSCISTGKFAWRPVASMTAMQYIDISIWPELYLQLIERQLRR
jgi:hypothetical protein